MPPYQQFEPEDFAADSSFRRWKLFDEPEDRKFWEAWLLAHPEKADFVEKAGQLLENIYRAYDQISSREIGEEIHRLSHSLEEAESETPVRRLWSSRMKFAVAASVLAVLGLLGWLAGRSVPENGPSATYADLVKQASEPLEERINDSEKPSLVVLSDGSTILLQPHSRAGFPRRFSGAKREVYLSGEAFFEVAKNPEKPFYVYANSLVTKVLGTSFTVRAFEADSQLKVVVKTGTVSVFARPKETGAGTLDEKKAEGVVLTPNQQVVYSPKETRLVRSLVEKPALLALPIQRQSFHFRRTPIAEVFSTLEESYGVQFVFDREVMKDCYLTASLSDEPLFEKIDLICRTIGAEYTQTDAHIIISSRGCRP
ncbi:FecR family protein [Larkinella soli]|uniref:FecR family protein n=1 Tax=Larkinella soli TaxID=1770527 RepID=UPI000FFC5451|nr:FecR family protein [Larkinella soli]